MERKVDFSRITACGECCDECSKKIQGDCPGCIETDGVVPGWAESGRCKVHSCTREHGVTVCAFCTEFPCSNITNLIHWNKNIIEHMEMLKEVYNEQNS